MLVDRLIVKAGIERRLADSIELALKLADDIVVINTLDGGDRLFSRRMACPICGISIPEMTPRAFSFNSPHGACPDVPGARRGLRLRSRAHRARRHACRSRPARSCRGRRAIAASSTRCSAGLQRTFGIDPQLPFGKLPKKLRDIVLFGAPGRRTSPVEPPQGSETKPKPSRRRRPIRSARTSRARFRTSGAGSKRARWTDQEALEPYRALQPCPACEGERLRPESRAVRVKGRRLAEYVSLPMADALPLVETLELTRARASDRRPRA